jgi:hypothetical protein
MSEEKVGLVTMGAGRGVSEIDTIGVGMLGYAFMGKAHSNAYKTLPYMAYPPPYVPQLGAIAGRNEEAVSEAARRYGFEYYVTDWAPTGRGRPRAAVRQLRAEQPAHRAVDRRRRGGQARGLREAAGPRRERVVRAWRRVRRA